MNTGMYDVIIVGSGVAGSFIAQELCKDGAGCLMLEAGKRFESTTYPRNELDANSQLYWGGGMEVNHDASIVFLRPKVVGGGSVVNQALVDRFDDIAFDSWRDVSGIGFFNRSDMAQWYEMAESEVAIQEIPEKYRNRNAQIYQSGFEKCGYRYAPLRRAQKDCRYEDGNDCIVCLSGCPLDSKQSMPATTLKRALEAGLELVADFEATQVEAVNGTIRVRGRSRAGEERSYESGRLVTAAGAIGNSRLLLNSGFDKRLPAIGRNFFTHPQFMNFGIFDEPVRSHKGPFQSLKSDDPNFRKDGFKLENVFAPPIGIAMLVPGFGEKHQACMKRMDHFACIEIAVRDTNPGRIRVDRRGRPVVTKSMNTEDRARYQRGLTAVNNVFRAAGAKEIINAGWAIGLHLMGGCCIGTDPARSVVDPDFRLHGHPNIYAADSSIFPNAPGINPSLTIMALAKKAAASIRGRR
ncbi:MAG: GMC family oxidoreductase [Acidobacteriota bacterium]